MTAPLQIETEPPVAKFALRDHVAAAFSHFSDVLPAGFAAMLLSAIAASRHFKRFHKMRIKC